MYIQPSTEIHILQNIPLNKSYEHTVFYKDAETQATEFLKCSESSRYYVKAAGQKLDNRMGNYG